MLRARRLIALLSLAAALAAPASCAALVVGIGDQTPDVFSDPRFLALGIKDARLSIPWDFFENRTQARALDRWLRAAKADGISPLISFDHHYPSERGHSLPSPGALARAFRIFRARYPWVSDFATWNEANHCGEPTCHRPDLVASYYRALRHVCPSCTVLGAELLDEPGMVAWVQAFDRALGGQPAIWGLHNYLGANRLQVASTLALLRATRSQIWFTETGGVVARHNHSPTSFPEGPIHASTVTGFIFNRLARLSPRITRVYLYQWNAGPGATQSWDSGLVGPEPAFKPRPAFATFVRIIAALPRSPLTPLAAAALLQPRRSLIVGALVASGAATARLLAGTVALHDAGNRRVLQTETVASGQRFAFAVAPGRYMLTGTRSGAGALCTAAGVSVRSGRGAIANVSCAAG